MKIFRGVGAALVVCAAAVAQSAPARLEFEVATVKPSPPPAPGQVPVGLHIDRALVTCRYFSLQDYMGMAYQLKVHQVVGPDWLSTEKYDVQAKVPEGVATAEIRDRIREMLQTLLEDRFKLKYHKETRELPVYALVVAKGGSKLKETPPDADADSARPRAVDVSVSAGRGSTTVRLPFGASITYGFLFLEAKKVNMPSLADNLARFMDRPVIDATDMTGNYDFRLEFSMEELRSMVRASGGDTSGFANAPDNMGTSVLTSLQSLGLKLEARKASVEVYVIDRAEKIPTEN